MKKEGRQATSGRPLKFPIIERSERNKDGFLFPSE